MCFRDYRIRFLLFVDVGENSLSIENSFWREYFRGKVVRNYFISWLINVRYLGKDVIIIISLICGMYYLKNGICNIIILLIV